MTETRCEPPEHLRGVDGWHWLDVDRPIVARWFAATDWSSECWRINSTQYSPQGAQKRGYRYLAPVTPPDVVARLVEALEGLMHWHPAPNVIRRMGLKPEPAEAAYEAACAALAAYREAGR